MLGGVHADCCFRRYLYDMTSKWLKGQSNYKLDKIYVWNAGVSGWDAGWGKAFQDVHMPWHSPHLTSQLALNMDMCASADRLRRTQHTP